MKVNMAASDMHLTTYFPINREHFTRSYDIIIIIFNLEYDRYILYFILLIDIFETVRVSAKRMEDICRFRPLLWNSLIAKMVLRDVDLLFEDNLFKSYYP